MSSTTANICCIAGCDNILSPRSHLRACALCRQSLCAWEKRPVGHILRRATNLKKYTARMAQIAVITDGEIVRRTPHTDLIAAGLAKAKRKARKGRKS